MNKLITTLFIYFLLTIQIFSQGEPTIEKFLDGIPVNDICTDGNNIWVATEGNGIYKYTKKSKKWINYSTSRNNLQHNFFYCIDANERFVWAGSTDGLFILDKKRGKWSKRKFGKGGQLSNWIRSIEYDKFDNVVWIGRFMFLTKLDLKKRRFYDYDLTINGNEKTNTIKTIKVDGDSIVWFGTEGGLHKYDKTKDLNDKTAFKFYDNRLNYFNGDGDQISISGILFEQENVWIGTDEFITPERPNFNVGGLYKFNRKDEWLRFDVTNGLSGNGIYTIEKTGNYIWVALYNFSKRTKERYGRGVVIINRLTLEVIPIDFEKLPQNIFSLHFDGENIWCGSNEGITKITLINKFTEWKR